MATNPATLAKVKDLTQKVEKLTKDTKALKAKLDFTIKELETQIKSKSTASIQLLLTALETQSAQMEALYIPLKTTRELAEAVGADNTYAAEHVQGIVKLTKQIDESEATVIAVLKASHTLEITAEKCLAAGASAEDQGETYLSKITVNSRFRKDAMQKAILKLEELQTNAEKAVQSRNATALKTAKDGARAIIEVQRRNTAQNAGMLAEFRKDYLGKSSSTAARTRWESEIKDMKKDLDSTDLILEACEILFKKIDGLTLATVDPKKAATDAGIDTAHAAELDKAMKGDDATRLKNLEALAKKLKLKVTGKDLFAKLRKGKHI